ncbi:CHAT domain-containing protein [Boletus edulis]|nr:CHAT domain-containing protein [Boletus edulis]
MQSSTPQHFYVASLKQEFGYPLRTPEPNSRLGQPYVREGLQIGDVGFVDEDGEFIWLFNIKFPLSDSDRLEKLPEEFHNRILIPPDTFIEFPEPVPKHGLDLEKVFTFGVERKLPESGPRRATYEFTATSKTGAILILPGGATLSKLEDKQKFKEIRQHATKYALQWCKYAQRDSLYLITAAYKTKTWTLGSFYEGSPGKDILVHRESGENSVYKWEYQFNVDHRRGPGNNDNDNQTVLIQGFRITVRWDWFRMIERVERPERWFARVLATFWPIRKSLRWLSQTKIKHVPTRNLSQPVHPLDVINRVLLDKNPRAKVAVTHDNAWIEMLENGLSHAELMQEDRVREFIQDRYTWDLDPEHNVVYLRSKLESSEGINSQPEPEDNHEDSSTLSPQSDDPRYTVTSMRLESIDIDCIYAGVSILVQFGNTIWRTENKPHASVIEWDDMIMLPSDLPINITICGAFQLGSTLGTRPICAVQTINTTELTGGTRIVRFSVGKVESCSSLLITLVRHVSYSEPHWSDDEDSVFVEQTKLGFKALYSHHDEPKNECLEYSLECFQRALKQCGLHTACRATALFNLATSRFIKYQAYGIYDELKTSIALYEKALELRNSGDPDRAATSLLLAQALVLCYGRESDESTVTQIEDLLADIQSHCSHHHQTVDIIMRTRRFHQAIDSGNPVQLDELLRDLGCHAYAPPYGFSDRPHMLHKLSVALWSRFQRLGKLSDLELAISTLRNIIGLTPHGHPDQAGRLNNLGGCFLTRFERLGELSDLEHATSTHRDAVRLTPDGHPDKPSRLSNLGNSFRARFERLGELSDLGDAISTHREAVHLTPHGHPRKPSHLHNLGNSFIARFERLGELSDLEDGISTHRDAVRFTPDGHPDKPSRLSNLGNSFRVRFERLGELSDLGDAISTHKDAVHLTPDGHPYKPSHLHNLGNSFIARFECLGELSDLEDATSKHREAVHLTPDGHPHKPSHLHNLGNSFMARFERLGELSDLEDAISTLREAVDLTPDGHPDKPSRLSNLGNSFRVRFERLGELSDLGDAISTHREAVHLTPHGHPRKPSHLHNLGNSFIARFERLGELSNLEDGISTHRDAVHLTPNGHPDKLSRLSNLGNSFRARFERLGELRDLEDAISTHRDAVHLTPDGHPHKPSHLHNLGSSFITRFQRLGELSDLEDGISTHRDAVQLTPHGHPDKPSRLSNLGNSFRARFERLGELRDLEDAISTHRDAVHLTPDGHPHKPSRLSNLGNSFITRFERLGELRDLEDAISTHRDAIDLTPHGHPDKPSRLNNLGNSFRARFERLGELRDLEDAISTHRDAVHLTPHGHPDTPSGLSNLGNSFITRFERLGELRDLEDAISTHRDAIDLTPHGHPDKPSRLSNLGNSFRARFEHLKELSDLENAIPLYSHSASVPIGPISVRFHASRNWILCARRMHHPSLLHAYSIAINLLPQLAWIGLSLTHRYAELKRGADVVREAAAAALDSGFPELAVEWLEQGRSIVWGELLQLRGSYEQLSSAHPDHARRFRELATALDDAGATREKSLSTLESTDDAMQCTTQTFQQEANRHRTLAIERDKLLQDIRRLPDFERFLLPKDFSQLRASAHSGPVVMLNAAETRCDALILLYGVDHVIHVPLPNFTFQRSVDLQNMLGTLVGDARAPPFDDRETTRGAGSWETFLSTLFNGVIKPVLDALAFSTVGDLSRIFWCPTGPFVFLPIHAAGLYGTQYSSPGHKVSDFVVSSYVPTLSILTRSPNFSVPPSDNLRLLFVPQPPSDGQIHLQGVARELRLISTVVGNSPSARTTLLESSVGTVEEVLGLMKDADWVHFACHGIQDAAKPTDSGLCLADGRRLKVSDIIGLSRSRGGLAILLACQSAMGDKDLTDEAIHIAAGMLFAGYGGVIGTMWSIRDNFAPVVAREVYEYLFRNGTRPDHRDAARALHEAVGRLRESGEAPFATWLPFIHVGL